MFHTDLSAEKGNSTVQDKRRILYVPMKVNQKTSARLCLHAAKHLDENRKKKNLYLDIGKYFPIVIKMSSATANCFYLLITGISFSKRRDEYII